MKHSALTALLFCLISLNAESQINIVNQSLTDTSRKIVYVKVENRMLITGTDKFDSIRVVNGLFERVSTKDCIIKPYAGDSCIVYFFRNNEVVDRKPFAVDPLPKPVPVLGNIHKQVITLDELLNNTKVSIELPGCYYKHKLVPYSYRFMIKSSKKDDDEILYSEINHHPVLTPEQIELIKKYKSDVIVVLDKFQIRSEGDSMISTIQAFYVYLQ